MQKEKTTTLPTTISKIVQIIFHPLIVPIICLFILFNCNLELYYIPLSIQFRLGILVLLTTVLMPVSLAYMLKSFVRNKDIVYFLNLIIVLILNFISYFFLKRIGGVVHNFIQLIFLVSSIVIFITIIISFWKKLNLYMLAISCVAGFITALSFIFNADLIYFLFSAFVISGFVGITQLILKKDNQFILYFSYIVGYISSIVVFILLTIFL